MFRFRLQRVLDLRERTERDAASALAMAQEQAELARQEEERLAAARDALAAQANGAMDAAAAQSGASIGALRTLHFLLGRLDERVSAAAEETTTAEHAVAQRQEELRSAFRDRRTLDRLRERHEESHRSAESAADRQRMDEIALSRFAQSVAQRSTADGATSPTNTTHES
jgi:flagellar protein FliJ